ncbi:hypothetical protein HAX54_020282, partial [Datura stramonium]|nr:hypothetical protein [Datura stramonium]
HPRYNDQKGENKGQEYNKNYDHNRYNDHIGRQRRPELNAHNVVAEDYNTQPEKIGSHAQNHSQTQESPCLTYQHMHKSGSESNTIGNYTMSPRFTNE